MVIYIPDISVMGYMDRVIMVRGKFLAYDTAKPEDTEHHQTWAVMSFASEIKVYLAKKLNTVATATGTTEAARTQWREGLAELFHHMESCWEYSKSIMGLSVPHASYARLICLPGDDGPRFIMEVSGDMRKHFQNTKGKDKQGREAAPKSLTTGESCDIPPPSCLTSITLRQNDRPRGWKTGRQP